MPSSLSSIRQFYLPGIRAQDIIDFLRQESETEELCTAVKQNSKQPFETTWFLGRMQLLTVPLFTFSPLSSVLILFPIRNVPDVASSKWFVCVS